MTTHSGVAVVGSANMDILFTVDRVPSPGETLLAESVALHPGGKGLNQAVAAARAGAVTTFVGALGRDSHGNQLAAVLTEDGIVDTLVRRVDEATGQAFIVVDGRGENTIIVASGANSSVVALTDDDRAAIAASSVLLLQLELPVGVVLAAAKFARSVGTTVMLNAAPAQPLAPELLESLDYLIVNEHEACLIAGSDDLSVASASLASLVGRVIVTLGSQGSALFDGGIEVGMVPALKVTAVDTTGAGDTFCGAFAAAIAEGRELAEAATFGTTAAALSVQRVGAVPSIPSRESIDAVLE
ncbi:MAG TPA: ribokinase [Leifsonia sp.]|nr:ribokinase [Leifsonia sp.]